MLIWIASYPRSGNTLLRLVLFHAFGLRTASIYGDPKDIASGKAFSDAVGHASLPPGWTPEAAREDDHLWLVKTHHPPIADDKAIYILRDGREASVSYLKYRNHHDAEKSTLADIITGRVTFGAWSDHIRAWEPAHRPNTLLLHFEALAANPLDCLPQLAAFLGVQPVSEEIPTFADLHAINPDFFRSGRTNSWQETFDEAHHLLFWLFQHEMMVAHGYGDGIPEPFREAPREALNHLSAATKNWVRDFSHQRDEQLWKREWELNEEAKTRCAELECQSQIHIAELERQSQSCIDELQAIQQRLQQKLDAMENSLSWKLTRPLRKLRTALHQFRESRSASRRPKT